MVSPITFRASENKCMVIGIYGAKWQVRETTEKAFFDDREELLRVVKAYPNFDF